MRVEQPHPNDARTLDSRGNRLVIFVVEYDATKFEKVACQIPASLRSEGVEILVINSSSTVAEDSRVEFNSEIKIRILRTSEDQGYGGTQKLAFRYAIENGFDFVALIRGD